MEMNPDAMTGAMELMDKAGLAMTADWGTAGERITSLTGGLGQGPLGAAYLATYPSTAPALMAAVARHCQVPGELATTGHRSAELYRASVRYAVDALEVPAPDLPAKADPRLA